MFNAQTNRYNLSLPPEWNSMANFKQFQIKPNTVMIVGDAFSQLGHGPQYVGEAVQWYINSLEGSLP